MAPALSFDPETQIPLLTGKNIFITGGTAGIGFHTVETLAKRQPASVYFTGRKEAAAEKLIQKLKQEGCLTPVHFIQMDLSSLASVKEGATKFLEAQKQLPEGGGRLDVLICNAGIMNVPVTASKDGYEMQWATNHMGHALLIKLLLPLLRSTATLPNSDVRVIILSSIAAVMSPGAIPLDTRKGKLNTSFIARKLNYNYTKLANLLYAKQLAKREEKNGILAVAVHPGVVRTGMVINQGLFTTAFIRLTNLRLLEPEQGAWAQLWCVGAPRTDAKGMEKGKGNLKGKGKGKTEGIVSGLVYGPVGVPQPRLSTSKVCNDEKAAEKLWEWTEKELECWV